MGVLPLSYFCKPPWSVDQRFEMNESGAAWPHERAYTHVRRAVAVFSAVHSATFIDELSRQTQHENEFNTI